MHGIHTSRLWQILGRNNHWDHQHSLDLSELDLDEFPSGGSGSSQANGETGEAGTQSIDESGAHTSLAASRSRVLVVDDEEEITRIIEEQLANCGYFCDRAATGMQALELFKKNSYGLVICDLRLPDIDGIEILHRIKNEDDDVAVLIITGMADIEVAIDALKSGASDFIMKPFDLVKLSRAVGLALEARARTVAHRLYQNALEETASTRGKELARKSRDYSNLLLNTVESLISTLEAKDRYTEGHSWKTALIAANIARQLHLDRLTVERISLTGLLHDIGKIGVPDSVLNKPERLTGEEYALVKQHPVIGEKILAPIEALRPLLPGMRHHHEWWNGKGYPDGLSAEKIPLEARILAVADAYDAITNARAYRPARTKEEALSIIRESAGTQFDPSIVEIFLRMPLQG